MGIWGTIITGLKTIGSRLLKPKDSKPLNDHSFRQTNVFSRVKQSIFVLNLPDKKQNLIGDIDKLPPNVLKALKENFLDAEPKKETTPKIRLIRSDFQKDMLEYKEYYEKEDRLLVKILPHLDYEFASILKLSSYVEKKYQEDDRKGAQRIKNDIGEQYGRDGRKLCNLYLKGYIRDMMANYVDIIFESATNKEEIGIRLNTLLRRIIKFSEYIFFIHQGININEIKEKIKYGMFRKTPYIALHSAGALNIGKSEKILKAIGKDEIFKQGYIVEQEPSKSTAYVPFFDIYITPIENKED